MIAVVTVAGVPAAVTAASKTVADVPWLAVIWAVGCVLMIGRLAAGLAQVRRWGRSAVAGGDVDFSPAITIPLTWGVVRPQILLPDQARTWPEDARKLVIRHEAAHVASHDWAWLIVARIVTAALWFHPLAWIAERALRREAERAADDAVIMGGVDPVTYADELVRVARSVTVSPVAAIGMVEPSSLEQRVRHVLDLTVGRARANRAVRTAVALFVGALSVSIAAFRVQPLTALQDQSADDRPVHRLGQGITDPRVLKEVPPVYTKEAMDKKIQGAVLLEIVITEEGKVSDKASEIKVIKSLEPSLDQSAIDAARQWLFEPARKDGEPVRVWVTLALSFRLK
jgi:TonB family protein